MQPDQQYFYQSFRQLSDEELADKFANPKLADEARAAIAQLLSERGVDTAQILQTMADEFAAIDPPPVIGQLEHPIPTEVVGSYSTAVEAEMICGLLAQAGIPATMSDAQTVTTNHLWSNAMGGVRVKVPFTDVEAAQAVIASWRDDDYQLQDVEEDDEAPPVQIGVGDWVPGYLREKSRGLLFRRFMAMMTDFLLFFIVINLLTAGGGMGWLAASLPPMWTHTGSGRAASMLPWEMSGLGAIELEMLASLPYFWLLEGLTGSTLGKYLWRVRVVNACGQRPGLLRTLPRTLLRLFELNPYLFGVLIGGGVAVMSKTGQRLGDMAGGTYVVDCEVLQQATAVQH